MIKIGSAIAEWHKHIIPDSFETLNAARGGLKFLAYEKSFRKVSEINAIPGLTSTVTEWSLALGTLDERAADIDVDDMVIWKSREYSVSNTDMIRIKSGLMRNEYIIYLKG